jgi:alpha-tubulin suppressor-like RCC1 family protein
VVAIAAGGWHSLALRTGGTVVGWGYNRYGQSTPPSGLSNVVAITAGGSHSLVLRSDGTVVAWGYNSHGQASPPEGLSNIVAIAAGWDHSLALRSGGTVVGWGNNDFGQSSPPAGLSNVVAIAAGGSHSLALRSDGTVVGWGSNSDGQATPPAGLSNVVAIAAGGSHSLALRTGGTVVGWGYNRYGQSTPPSGLRNVVAIAAGGWHSLALRTGGTVVGWGYNRYAQSTPPSGLSNVVAIAAGGSHSLVLRSDGTVVAWGYNSHGQASPPDGLSNIVAIAAGGFHSLALRRDGTVVGWGDNSDRQATPPAGLSNVVAIAAGGYHSLALRSDGTVVGWGDDYSGQATAPASLSNAVAIAAGYGHSLALKSDGTVVGWGRNDYGQATPPPGLSNVVAIAAGGSHSLALRGDGTVVGWGSTWIWSDDGQVIPPAGLSNVVAIAAGRRHSLALRRDGTVVGWGWNDGGQATPPAGLSNVVAIAAGDYYSLALKSDGTIVGWGDNLYHLSSPPAGLSNVVAIAAGSSHSLALVATDFRQNTNPPVVTNLRVAQRPGTKLVDIAYDLADPDSSSLRVVVEFSTNGGLTYSPLPGSVSGAVGPGVAPGSNRKITWDAGSGWNGQFSANVRFRVIAYDESFASAPAQSAPVTVDTQDRAITVSGRVLDPVTRAPVAGAVVSVGGRNTTTGSSGEFALSGVVLSSGNTLTVSKPGLGVYSGSTPAVAGAKTVVVPDVALVAAPPNRPVVRGIRAQYDGLFLSGVSIMNEYTATVDWNGTPPGSVEFYVNGRLARTVPTSGTEATAEIDMAFGFAGSLRPGANKLRAVAVAADGRRSAPFDQKVTILPLPVFLVDQAILLPFEFIPNNDPVISWEFNFPRSFPASDVKQIPFIGKFGPDFNFDVAFDYKVLTGEWGLFVGREWEKRLHYRRGRRPNFDPRHPGWYFGNLDFKWAFGGKAEGKASQTSGVVVDRVGVGLEARLRQEILSFYFTDYVPGGQLVRLLDHLKRVGLDINRIQRVRVDGLVNAELSAMLKFPALAFDDATFTLGFGLEAIYQPSVYVAHASINVGGSIAGEIELAPNFGIQEVTGSIYMELYFDSWLTRAYQEKFSIVHGRLYPRSGGRGPSWAPPRAESLDGSLSVLDGQWVVLRVVSDSPRTIPRDYLLDGLERFVAQDETAQLAGRGRVLLSPDAAAQPLSRLEAFRQVGRSVPRKVIKAANEGQPQSGPTPGEPPGVGQADLTIVENLFPYSSPAMASRGAELMLLYVSDNGSPNALQFTDIKWTRWDGTNWSVLATLHTNTQAEFNPQVAYDGNGDAIAVWERVADPHFNETNLTAMAAQMEIVWSRWNRASGQWSAPRPLTANGYLDHAPLLCGPMSDGSVLLVWTANTQNLLMGTNGAGSQVLWARWNPASGSWSAPQTLVADLPFRLSQSLAGVSNRAVYVWTRDLDGVLTNATDQQVFYCQWENGAWGPPTQLTTDTNANRNARVAVAPSGNTFMVWQQGTNLVLARNFSTNVTLARADSQTAGFADFAMTIGPAGNLVLLWQEMSPNGSDAHYAVYDPLSDTWSRDDLLCNDPSLERSFAPVWDDLGNLTVAYNKVEMFRTNLTLTLEDGGTVTVSNVLQPGRVDLVVTKRALVKDLAILPGDFWAQGLNYLPGDPVTLTATVRNVGNVAMSNVRVAFWDGNPTNGGTLITNVTLPGWLVAASTNTASAIWVVPEPATNHVLHAVVNPAGLGSEFDEANNMQRVRIGGTDLSVSVVRWSAETNGSVRVIAQVQNLGAPTATNSVLAIRPHGSTNAPLATAEVPPLEPGRLAQVALDLPPGTQPAGEAFYTLHADETLVTGDVDMDNNTATFAVTLWTDSDGDGMPDDYEAQFPFLDPLDPNDAGLDHDGDGLSNLEEYLAGTDPGDPLSYLRITAVGIGEGRAVVIVWGSAPNRFYTIERTADLKAGFTPLVEHIPATPPENVFVDSGATNSAQFFYRVRVE